MIQLRKLISGLPISVRLPAPEIRLFTLMKTGFWLLAIVWLVYGGAWAGFGDLFRSEPEYMRQNRIAACRSLRTSSARYECINRQYVAEDNKAFYIVCLTLAPPLILIPVYRRIARRMGKRGERRVRIPFFPA